MTPTEFFNRCKNHDWYYDFSDDYRVWQRGTAARDELRRLIAEAGADRSVFQAIYDKWRDYMFNGPSWGTEKPPEPQPPQTYYMDGEKV